MSDEALTAYSAIESTQESKPSKATKPNTRIHTLYSVIHFKVLKKGETWAHVQLHTKEGERDTNILITIPRSLNADQTMEVGQFYVARIESVTTFDAYDHSIKVTNWLKEIPMAGQFF